MSVGADVLVLDGKEIEITANCLGLNAWIPISETDRITLIKFAVSLKSRVKKGGGVLTRV
jgi:hypothetical protein